VKQNTKKIAFIETIHEYRGSHLSVLWLSESSLIPTPK